MGMLLSLVLVGCSPKKGKLISFESLSSYYPYPQEMERFKVYLQEGQPDYVVFGHEEYEERWVYVCKDMVYNFKPLAPGKDQPLKISFHGLRATKIESKLSRADRERLGNCKKKGTEQKQGERGSGP